MARIVVLLAVFAVAFAVASDDVMDVLQSLEHELDSEHPAPEADVEVSEGETKFRHAEVSDIAKLLDKLESKLRNQKGSDRSTRKSKEADIKKLQGDVENLKSSDSRIDREIELVAMVRESLSGFKVEDSDYGKVHSCREIKAKNSKAKSGWFHVVNVNGGWERVYCDMTTDGGGYTLCTQQSAKDGINFPLGQCRAQFTRLGGKLPDFAIFKVWNRADVDWNVKQDSIFRISGNINDFFTAKSGGSWRYSGSPACHLKALSGSTFFAHVNNRCYFDHGSGGLADFCLGTNGHFCAYTAHSSGAYRHKLHMRNKWKTNWGYFSIYYR